MRLAAALARRAFLSQNRHIRLAIPGSIPRS